jgi:hypothetical protein
LLARESVCAVLGWCTGQLVRRYGELMRERRRDGAKSSPPTSNFAVVELVAFGWFWFLPKKRMRLHGIQTYCDSLRLEHTAGRALERAENSSAHRRRIGPSFERRHRAETVPSRSFLLRSFVITYRYQKIKRFKSLKKYDAHLSGAVPQLRLEGRDGKDGGLPLRRARGGGCVHVESSWPIA